MKKILIFASRTGGGHISLAEAIRDRVQPKYEVQIVDPQPGVIHLHYRMVSRHALWLWEAEFKLSDGQRRARVAHEVAKHTLAVPVARAIHQARPDLVISTYPFLTSEVVYAMRLFRLERPFAMLFADPNGVHRSWLTEKHAAAAFAPTRETYEQALASGFDPRRTHFTGWPVRGQFYHAGPNTRSEVLPRLGLDERRFTIFLQGGGEGAAHFALTVEGLLGIDGVQIILATGSNRALYREYQGRDRIQPLPFTREIAPYMAAADVVMGKAGPNMLFESVTLGKPFIAASYIPGQEEVNLEFIARHGLGWAALTTREQQDLIRSLRSSPREMEAKLTSVQAYRLENAAATAQIPNLIDRLIG